VEPYLSESAASQTVATVKDLDNVEDVSKIAELVSFR
jgi:hypothetical protein